MSLPSSWTSACSHSVSSFQISRLWSPPRSYFRRKRTEWDVLWPRRGFFCIIPHFSLTTFYLWRYRRVPSSGDSPTSFDRVWSFYKFKILVLVGYPTQSSPFSIRALAGFVHIPVLICVPPFFFHGNPWPEKRKDCAAGSSFTSSLEWTKANYCIFRISPEAWSTRLPAFHEVWAI